MKFVKEKPKKSGCYYVIVKGDKYEPSFCSDGTSGVRIGNYHVDKDKGDKDFLNNEDCFWIEGDDINFPLEEILAWSDEPLPDPPDNWDYVDNGIIIYE